MPANVSSITLIPEERRNLKKLKHGAAIPDEAAIALNHLGLSEPIYGQEPDGSVSILGWKISADGLRYFAYRREQRKRLIINSVVFPIIVAIITSAITVYILPTVGKKATEWLQSGSQSTE